MFGQWYSFQYLKGRNFHEPQNDVIRLPPRRTSRSPPFSLHSLPIQRHRTGPILFPFFSFFFFLFFFFSRRCSCPRIPVERGNDTVRSSPSAKWKRVPWFFRPRRLDIGSVAGNLSTDRDTIHTVVGPTLDNQPHTDRFSAFSFGSVFSLSGITRGQRSDL